MSYNVRDFLDDRRAAARVVRAVAPDVLCLQEVPRRLTTEVRLPRFAQECGMHWGRGRFGTGGTSVLTAPGVAVVASPHGRLRTRFPDRTRGWAGVTVTPDGWPPDASVTVVSIHLGLRSGERVRHAEHLVATLPARSVVAGDLNEGPEGDARRVLTRHWPPVLPDEPTFPAASPSVAIDAVLAVPDLVAAQSDPSDPGDPHRPGGRDALERAIAADVAVASDHRPLWVDLVPKGVEG
ncbi:endonuclease/exonuclease/phosphatase family protein [Intrasporangium sp. YIM S08009]|uniref:endonuclease/exonuclease/phosphatase family protein n=1 Tax=Intrasporangium zincisolvens TaxID=3080018 RepID=UPI002B05E50E|nr:endonuclease/exonuclease/phosphatase family protein [Intrasporangium sp. YIM S08009]